jgi:hypothetical protein
MKDSFIRASKDPLESNHFTCRMPSGRTSGDNKILTRGSTISLRDDCLYGINMI